MNKPDVFDEAFTKLQTDGIKVWMHPIVKPYAPRIFTMMLSHYEQREEYEKCLFLKNVWEKYQKSLTISNIISSLK